MNTPDIPQINKLLQHCEGLTDTNNGYTKIFNSSHNTNIIDKKVWVFCTKYAELLVKANEQFIKDFLCDYRKLKEVKITDVDYNYYKNGDNGDLFYIYGESSYMMHIKSCPECMYKSIKNKLKKNNRNNFMSLAVIVIRKDILPLKQELKDLYSSNINEFIDYVVTDIYKESIMKISDLQFINNFDICLVDK